MLHKRLGPASMLLCICLLSVLAFLSAGWGARPAYAAASTSAPISVYVAPGDKSVYALDPATGAKRWSYLTAAYQNNTPRVSYGSLYIGGESRTFYALNTPGGTLKWQATIKGITTGRATATSGGVYFTTAVNAGKPTEVDYLYALSGKDGHKLWSYTLPGQPDTSAAPLVVGSRLYLEANATLFAFNVTNGTVIWQQPGYLTQPSIYNGTLYSVSDVNVGNNYPTICALSASSGSLLWCQTIGGGSADFYFSPLIANGTIYAGDIYGGTLYALRTTDGSVIWQFNTTDSNPAVFSRPTVVNGAVYFQDDQSVYALNVGTGAQIWKYAAPPGDIEGTPGVSSSTGLVYINGNSNNTFKNYTAALRTSDGTLAWSVNWSDAQIIAPLGGPVVG